MKILFVAAEVAPFSSIGGLSQVMSFLPRALTKLGHDVRVFTAKYGVIDGSGGNQPPKKKWKMDMVAEGLAVPVGGVGQPKQADNGDSTSDKLICNIKMGRASVDDSIVYFLENREYYELRANVYQYADDHVRFALLSKGCLEWLLQARSAWHEARGKDDMNANLASSLEPRAASGGHPWWPDLIHINDWHTGYLADMARRDPRYKEIFRNTPIVYTVHNFRHQGSSAHDFRFEPRQERDTGDTPLPDLFHPALLKINALVRGVVNADVVNTVSKTHALEILTPEYGEGIDDILVKYKEKLTGILNGIDTTLFNPLTDKHIKRRFGVRTLANRDENKLALQKEFGLPVSATTPLLAISGRMERQKGIDLLMETLPRLLTHHEFQFIAVGGGDEQYRTFLDALSQKYPGRVGVYLQPDFTLPRKVFAGADLLFLPSKFEPGGIVAMEAMRYGCVPLVRRTGGLNDIVTDFDPQTKVGNGFSFKEYDPWALYGVVTQALQLHKDRACWVRLMKNCMQSDFSWVHAAKEYEQMYRNITNKERP